MKKKHALLSLPLASLLFATSHQSLAVNSGKISGNEFNPAISLILDGRYTDIDQSELTLPGFQLGGEAALPENGFSSGHNELSISANIDEKFYGALHAAVIYEDYETILEIEEAFIETLGLGKGFTIKGGRFFSGIGYLNSIHLHAHDFADRPLVYDALLGGRLSETGLQARWIAPTDLYLNLGLEVNTGSEYPSGENEENNKGIAVFIKTGGDIGNNASWQAGASHYSAEFDVREAGGHHHGEEEGGADNELLEGEVEISGIDFVYKWAPKGNARRTYVKLQAEYFLREERANAEFVEGADSAEAYYDGEQSGYYMQAIYQFIPQWRVGLRYDKLEASNRIENFVDNGIDQDEFLEESNLGDQENPEKHNLMVDYSPSHFSRIRLQFSRLNNGIGEDNDMLQLQYVMSLGSHGAHTY